MPRSLTRRSVPFNSGRKAPTEHHGARVSIKREETDEDGNMRYVETHYVRGGATRTDLDNYAFWWLDRYAEAFPGVLFIATMSANNQVARVRVPKDFPAIPLPEDSREYDERRRAEAIERDQRARDKELRRVLRESDRVLARLREVMGG